MHGLADIVVATEREREVADTTTDVSTWQFFPNPLGSSDEVGSIGVVFLHTGCYSQNVGVENDI